MKTDLKSLTYENLESLMLSMGEKKFRSQQLYQWIHNKHINDVNKMNISKTLRENLSANYYIAQGEIVTKLSSKLDETEKYLLKYNEDLCECVFMKYKHGNTVCISTQVGCKMGCEFCASTVNGFTRNLTTGEMLDQVYTVHKNSGKISNIVLMGSGEPLDNLENVVDFIKIINSESGLNIGQRHITLSTCGIPPKIDELSKLNLQINLAISLHAFDDEKRNAIMPINRKYSLQELLSSVKNYYYTTSRRITYEYALIKDLNDNPRDAFRLGRLIKPVAKCHVNLIPVNYIKEKDFKQSNNAKIFQETLQKMGIETTIRRELGSDINASCGQLRNEYIKKV
ncbi:MAG: 23S rRNA (adenine(2503)-C(2))-methyltransferase RlmN [Lachnospirales bacterium]